MSRLRSTFGLRFGAARYRELVEGMSQGVAICEPIERGVDFVLREHNRAGERITGIARDRIIGRRLTETFFRLRAPGLLEIVRRVWRTGAAESFSTTLLRDDEAFAWIEGHVFMLSGEELVVVYTDATERKRAEAILRSSRNRLRRLAAGIEATREAERTCIAREIHDKLGQALTGLKMDLAWLRDHLPQADTKSFNERLAAADALATVTLDAMRDLAAHLRPSLLDDLGLTAAIEWQVKEFGKRFGYDYELDLTEDDIGLCRERDTAIFRTLQEALANVAHHGPGRRLRVRLAATEDTLELVVADEGKGLNGVDAYGLTSLAIIALHERARAIGGRLDIRTRPDGSTQVFVEVPRSGPYPKADTVACL